LYELIEGKHPFKQINGSVNFMKILDCKYDAVSVVDDYTKELIPIISGTITPVFILIYFNFFFFFYSFINVFFLCYN
jgi:hypothetical protein